MLERRLRFGETQCQPGPVPEPDGTTTRDHLLEALIAESLANRRMLWLAQRAEIDGRPAVAAALRTIAEAETAHAFGLLEHLVDLGEIDDDLDGALAELVATERQAAETGYPGSARVARAEGHEVIAEWFESLAEAEREHVARLTGPDGVAVVDPVGE